VIRLDDDLILLREVPRRLSGSPRLAVSTVYRWAFRGVGRPPVRLETLKCGGRRYTTLAALADFFAAAPGRPGAAPTSAADVAASLAADRECDAEGI
jgi:hypothetical protein